MKANKGGSAAQDLFLGVGPRVFVQDRPSKCLGLEGSVLDLIVNRTLKTCGFEHQNRVIGHSNYSLAGKS